MKSAKWFALFLTLCGVCVAKPLPDEKDLLDTLYFGDKSGEAAHQLNATQSSVAAEGALGQPDRILLPLDPPTWEGGRLSFKMKIDPSLQNYFTIKLWGSDISGDRLVLFVEGKQVGYHHIGDVDLLDFGNGEGEPPFNDRFYYNTSPLPLEMTRGKSELACEIRSIGPIWSYGSTFEQYQKTMAQPTRGLYAVYTHTSGCFSPPATEKQGTMPVNPPVRQRPGIEVLAQVKQRVNGEIRAEIQSSRPLDEMQICYLARAYGVTWCEAYHNPKVLEQVTRGMDQLFVDWQKNPTLALEDPKTPNAAWFPFGPAGEAVTLLAKPLAGVLDQRLEGSQIHRREAWSQLLQAGRSNRIQHRRMYTNQSMIVDLNMSWSNRGVAAIDPAHKWPQTQVLKYLYQSIGLKPWTGSETNNGPENPMGDDYYVVTSKGLTKELGYVGYYGEVLDWVTGIYDSTRPTPRAPGDENIRRQIIKLAKARAVFRYPALDRDGNRAMRIETLVGWRDDHRPGDVCYAERPTWDGSSLDITAATMDPTLIGYVQQMFDDGQFFSGVSEQLKTPGLRVTAGMLMDVDQFEALTSQPPRAARLPMSAGQPDFVWADEQDGVIAIKHRDQVLYASLYWRARNAVNFLARVHDVHPNFERMAVVAEEVDFVPSGSTFTRPNNIDQSGNVGGFHYPGGIQPALAGEQLPIAKFPPGDHHRLGEEDPAAGRGSFYSLRYGNFLIGMNATADQRFALKVPHASQYALNLMSGKIIDLALPVTVGPNSTVVLDLSARNVR